MFNCYLELFFLVNLSFFINNRMCKNNKHSCKCHNPCYNPSHNPCYKYIVVSPKPCPSRIIYPKQCCHSTNSSHKRCHSNAKHKSKD
jgi:hypothetical protein